LSWRTALRSSIHFSLNTSRSVLLLRLPLLIYPRCCFSSSTYNHKLQASPENLEFSTIMKEAYKTTASTFRENQAHSQHNLFGRYGSVERRLIGCSDSRRQNVSYSQSIPFAMLLTLPDYLLQDFTPTLPSSAAISTSTFTAPYSIHSRQSSARCSMAD